MLPQENAVYYVEQRRDPAFTQVLQESSLKPTL